MSADNYLYVDKMASGRYGIWHLFASDNYEAIKPEPVKVCDSANEAIITAHKMVQDDYYEYGVSVAPDVLKEAI